MQFQLYIIMQTPILISFANYKGGVGKSTLCACYALYLAKMGINIKVVDCDPQHSLYETRRKEIFNSEDTPDIPYQIDSAKVSTPEEMLTLIEDLYNHPEYEMILLDCPGNKDNDWYRPLLANSDLLIIPYQYEKLSVSATTEFVLFVNTINETLRDNTPIELVFIPNRIDRRVGKETELKLWSATESAFSGYGLVTSRLSVKAEMTRFSTIHDNNLLSEFLQEAFEQIFSFYKNDKRPWNN